MILSAVLVGWFVCVSERPLRNEPRNSSINAAIDFHKIW